VDKNIKIQLGSTKNINSTDVDTYEKIKLDNQRNEILEYDIKNILSVTDVFEAERQNTEVYRIYGGIEYLSILNGLPNDYPNNYIWLEDYFRPKTYSDFNNFYVKTIYNSFDFYLLRPKGYKRLSNTNNEYVLELEVIATPNHFDLFNMGYSRNIFDEPKYGFIFNKDFDVSNWVDGFGFPITELYLFPQYKPNSDGREGVRESYWANDGFEWTRNYYSPSLNIGDIIEGDKIKYYKSNYSQVIHSKKKFYIRTFNRKENVIRQFYWKYEPFIPLKLRYLSNEVSKANINEDNYEQRSNIPHYATDLGNGNMIWREILEQGYIDPLTGEGVDYPFVNKRRYLFSNIMLSIPPDMEHTDTARIFNEIEFGEPNTLNKSPLNEDNLNNIGKPC